jgi:predicted XRE-type DNA-binding protein
MARKRDAEDDVVVHGTTNVFADLGYKDAEERQTKLRLAFAINGILAQRKLNQSAAADILGVNQPKVSALLRYKLEGFSVERLMIFLTALDRDVEIFIRQKPRSHPTGRISVIAPRPRRAAASGGDTARAKRSGR